MKICSVEGCSLPQFGGGYCKTHQWRRERSGNTSKPRSLLRRTKPSLISNKRSVENKSYREVCREIDREAIADKNYYCFFCGVGLWGRPDHHHLRGRGGMLLIDKRYLVLAHRECHSEYHRYTIAQLLETGWYGSFLVRLRSKDDVSYNKEIRKLEKHFDI